MDGERTVPETEIKPFVKKGMERIKRVDQAAESLVTEMGLPKDAKYGLMAKAHGGQPDAPAAPQPAAATPEEEK